MSLRTRLTMAIAMAALLPLAGVAWLVTRRVADRIAAERADRAADVLGTVRHALDDDARRMATGLAAVARALEAGHASLTQLSSLAALARVDALELYDRDGRVVASAQFPEDRGRQVPGLLASVPAPGEALVLRTRNAAEPFLVLATAVLLPAGSEWGLILGGHRVEPGVVPGMGAGASVILEPPGTTVPAGTGTALALPYLDLLARAPRQDSVLLAVQPIDPGLERLGADLRNALIVAVAATAGLAIVGASLIAHRLRRPVDDLVRQVETLDLDRLEVSPGNADHDLAAVSTALRTLQGRLGASAERLRAAEHRAAAGDAARRVTHDLRNGLAPIRNVVRHLDEVAADDPARLPAVYAERSQTLRDAVGWLDALARDWAGRGDATDGRAEVLAVARQVAAELGDRRLTVVTATAAGPVALDDTSLHRVLANLAANALQSLPTGHGSVTIGWLPGADHVRLEVTDTGRGMTRSELERALAGGWTTREGGSGLGLAVVRQVVEGAGGAIRVETEPGRGTRVELTLPVAGKTGA